MQKCYLNTDSHTIQYREAPEQWEQEISETVEEIHTMMYQQVLKLIQDYESKWVETMRESYLCRRDTFERERRYW